MKFNNIRAYIIMLIFIFVFKSLFTIILHLAFVFNQYINPIPPLIPLHITPKTYLIIPLILTL